MPITVSGEAKQTLCESSTVSAETNIAPYQYVNTVCEAIKVPCEPKHSLLRLHGLQNLESHVRLKINLLIQLPVKLK